MTSFFKVRSKISGSVAKVVKFQPLVRNNPPSAQLEAAACTIKALCRGEVSSVESPRYLDPHQHPSV
jgi:hypothetical protein